MSPRYLILGCLALSGCASLPAPDAQLRITEHGGEGSAVLFGAAGIKGCIISVVGQLPEELTVVYAGERCQVRLAPLAAPSTPPARSAFPEAL